MDRLQALQVFVRVARLGSFSAAARELGMSAAAVSRNIAALEGDLGAQLLRRTTRSVSRTPAGDRCLRHAEALLDEHTVLVEAVRQDVDEARGHVRMTAGVSFTDEHLGRAMAGFLVDQPAVSVEILLTDEHIDLVRQGLDLAVRIGKLPDSSMRARRICPTLNVLCCSPGYADAHGLPTAPGGLSAHALLVDTNVARQWKLVGPDGESHDQDVAGRFAVNSPRITRDCCVDGLGIGMMPTFMCGPDIASGRLVRVLPDWTGPEMSMYAVFPSGRHVGAAVRSVIDFLVARFGGSPEWDAGVPGRLLT